MKKPETIQTEQALVNKICKIHGETPEIKGDLMFAEYYVPYVYESFFIKKRYFLVKMITAEAEINRTLSAENWAVGVIECKDQNTLEHCMAYIFENTNYDRNIRQYIEIEEGRHYNEEDLKAFKANNPEVLLENIGNGL